MKYASVIVVAAAMFVLGAGPSALADKPLKFVVWTGLIACASYLKGKFEEKP